MKLETYLKKRGRGAKSDLARSATCCPAQITKMLKGENVSAYSALRVEHATGGQVRAETIAMSDRQREVLLMIRRGMAA